MRRRNLLVLVIALPICWSGASYAQQAVMPVVGVLSPGSPHTASQTLAKFVEGLRETGFDEQKNVAFEYRWAEGHNDRLPSLASELVERHVNVILTGSMPAIRAAMKATSKIPIVVVMGVDPVATGV